MKEEIEWSRKEKREREMRRKDRRIFRIFLSFE